MQPLYEYVCHMKGHRNSKGELAEWVIKSHETGKILSSHKSEQKAKEHLQQMHIFGESVEGEAACSHCGCSAYGVEEYNGRLLCPYCLKEFQRLDACRDDNGYVKYDNITNRSDGFNPACYKLIGESSDGNDMDKRIKIFMEGVSQLGLSKNQVDAIGKITNVCMEGVVGNGELTRDEEAYEHILQCLHEMDIPDETIEIATHILGDSKETLIKIGNAIATMINNGDWGYRHEPCFNYDHKTGKVKFCMEGVGRRPIPYIEDRATATNPDLDYRSRYRALVANGVSRTTLSILTTILGATVNTLNKIGQAKHELEERDNMRIPAEAFRNWDNGHGDEEIGSMDFGGDFGNEVDLGEIGKISENQEPKDGPDSTDKFVIDAFYRAVAKLLGKYPNRLYEDETAGVIGDKITGKKFSIDFDPMHRQIEVRSKDDRKTYPLWFNKSKSMDALIELIMDIFSEELGTPDNHTTGGDSAVDEEQPEF